MTRLHFHSTVCTMALLATAAVATPPAWTETTPAAPGYLVAVASAEIRTTRSAAEHEALSNALAVLAAQLDVSVAGRTHRTWTETDDALHQAASSAVQTVSDVRLEGVEVVDRFTDSHRSWVYVRLHEETLRARRQARLDETVRVVDEAVTALASTTSSEADALRAGVTAWAELRDQRAAGTGDVDGMLRQEHQSILAQLCLRLAGLQLHTRTTPAGVEIAVRRDDAETADLSAVPVRVIANDGRERVVWTGADGTAQLPTRWLAGHEAAVTLDLDVLTGQDTKIDSGLLPVPVVRVRLPARTRRVALTGRTREAGETRSLSSLRGPIAQSLNRQGFHVAETASRTIDVELSVQARSRIGAMHFAWVDVAVTLTDYPTGRVLFQDGLRHLKGAGPTPDRALDAAIEGADSLLRVAAHSIHGADATHDSASLHR